MEGHRKIELQTPEDFSYLIRNVRRAATDSLHAAFPPVEGGDAADNGMRVQIEEMVDDYILRTFHLVAPNITINGLDVDASTFVGPLPSSSTKAKKRSATSGMPSKPEATPLYEPFDASKRARVEQLVREEEDLLRDIAGLKRKVPAAAAEAWHQRTREGIAEDESVLEAARERIKEARLVQEQTLTKGKEMFERQEEMEGRFRGAVAVLESLTSKMPATVARMDRARVAGEYVITGV